MGVKDLFWPALKDLPPEERKAEIARLEALLRAQAEKAREARGEPSPGLSDEKRKRCGLRRAKG